MRPHGRRRPPASGGYGRAVDPSADLAARLQPLSDALAAGDATLDELTLAVSAVLRPRIDPMVTMVELDELAATCPSPTRDGVIRHLAEAGFDGEHGDYGHWRNSCLDRVVSGRRGIPITLAVVAIEVGRRVGVELVGVGLPGHFLVGDPGDRSWLADPFHRRTDLGPEDARELLAGLGLAKWSDRFLDPVPNRAIVARMLNNLKVTCERRGDRVQLALVMAARQLLPEFADEESEAVRARGVLN